MRAEIPIHQSIPLDLELEIRAGLETVREMSWLTESQYHRDLFGHSTGGATYLSYLSVVAGVFYSEGDHRGFYAYAVPGYNIVYLTPLIRESKVPLLELVYALLHEVKHFGPLLIQHRHVPCPSHDLLGEPLISHENKSYEGRLACDDYGDGAFGLGVVMMGQILNHCDNCTLEMKSDARKLGKKLLSRIIDPLWFFRYQREYQF